MQKTMNNTRKWNPSKSMDWLQTSQDHQVVALDTFGPCILMILGSQAASLTFAECASANSRCSWEKHHEMCPEGLGNNTWRASKASCNFLQLGRWLPVYGVAYMCPWRFLLKGLQHLSWNMHMRENMKTSALDCVKRAGDVFIWGGSKIWLPQTIGFPILMTWMILAIPILRNLQIPYWMRSLEVNCVRPLVERHVCLDEGGVASPVSHTENDIHWKYTMGLPEIRYHQKSHIVHISWSSISDFKTQQFYGRISGYPPFSDRTSP